MCVCIYVSVHARVWLLGQTTDYKISDYPSIQTNWQQVCQVYHHKNLFL